MSGAKAVRITQEMLKNVKDQILSQVNAAEQVLQIEPTGPQRLPTRWAIPFATQIAPLLGDKAPKVQYGEGIRNAVSQMGNQAQ